jgi:hypothetical protein
MFDDSDDANAECGDTEETFHQVGAITDVGLTNDGRVYFVVEGLPSFLLPPDIADALALDLIRMAGMSRNLIRDDDAVEAEAEAEAPEFIFDEPIE